MYKRQTFPNLLFSDDTFLDLLFPDDVFPDLHFSDDIFPDLLFSEDTFPNLLFSENTFPNLLFSDDTFLDLLFSEDTFPDLLAQCFNEFTNNLISVIKPAFLDRDLQVSLEELLILQTNRNNSIFQVFPGKKNNFLSEPI